MCFCVHFVYVLTTCMPVWGFGFKTFFVIALLCQLQYLKAVPHRQIMCTSFYGNVSMLSSSPHIETWSCRGHPKLMAGLHSLCHSLPKLAAVEAKLNANGLVWTLHDLTVAYFVGTCRFIQNILLRLSCCILHAWSEMSIMSQWMSSHLNALLHVGCLVRTRRFLQNGRSKLNWYMGANFWTERECSGVHPSCLTK